MNKLRIGSMMMLMVMMLSLVTSCSKDEDDYDNNPEALLGGWKFDSTSGEDPVYDFIEFYSTEGGNVYFHKEGMSGTFGCEISEGIINYKMKISVNFGAGYYRDEGSWRYHVKDNTLYLDGKKYKKYFELSDLFK